MTNDQLRGIGCALVFLNIITVIIIVVIMLIHG